MSLRTLPDDIKALWMRLSPKLRYEIKSGIHTFVTASVIEAGVQYHIHGNALPTDTGVILAILAVILRSGLKALLTFVFAEKKAIKKK
jgi:hypothetical protein